MRNGVAAKVDAARTSPDAASPAPRASRHGRLFRKYLLLILTLVSGALLASGAISVYFAYQEHKTALGSLQQEKAIAAASRIEQYIRQIQQQLAFAALPQLDASDVELRRIEFLKLLRQVPEVTDIAQIDGAGREQVAVSRLGMDVLASGKDRSQEPAFRGAKRGQPWVGPVYFRKETEPYMTIAIRSGGDNGPVTIADVNLKFIWDVVSRIKIGDKGKAYVVDRNGYLVADPDIGLVLRKTNLSDLAHVRAAAERQDSDDAALLSKDLAGTPVLTSMAPIESLDWRVFVEQPVAEVYAKLNASILRTVLLLLAGLVISAVGALALARGMVRPIRTLSEGAQRIGEGNLDQNIEVKTGDELEALADRFNRMSAQLRESYAGLERKVDERTHELTNSLEQQTAISEILRVISSSPTDVQPVLDTVAERAAHLTGAPFARIMLVEGSRLLPAAEYWNGKLTEDAGRGGTTPVPLDRSSISGRAAIDRDAVHIADIAPLLASEFAGAAENMTRFDCRAVLAVPLMREGGAYGAIVLARHEPGLFAPDQVALVQTFARQAAIAIDNVRLFNETKEALDQQRASGEVLAAISSSIADTGPVFEKILASCERLFAGKVAVINLVGEDGLLRLGAYHGPGQEKMEELYPMPSDESTATGVAIRRRVVVHFPDVEHGEGVPEHAREVWNAMGVKAAIGAPMIWENRGIGSIFVGRDHAGPFSDKDVTLLKTFADQAVIAIQNARLFNETKEALDQQRASGEVLSAISSSIADTSPVFDKILTSCERLFAGKLIGITLVGGDDLVRIAAYHGPGREELDRIFPAPIDGDTGTGVAILRRGVFHVPDVEGGADMPPRMRQGCAAIGVRAIVFAPMMWEGRGIGAIFVGRDHAGPFSDKDIALLRTFADQAVIAIQNARLFREIEDKSRQLEVANQHKSAFLASMSHELRTPLNAIIGFSEVLLARFFGELNEKQDDYLKDIHSSGKHLLALINDVLDLSKVEAGRMELELSEFDAPAALSDAMTLIRERAMKHGIALGLDVTPGIAAMTADERKFKQILLNLLSNAVKFTPDGGRVDVSATRDGAGLVVAVRDTGIGIAPEDQQAVFEEFRQVGAHYTSKAEGTGLGLALTRRFVELHGGRIWLESAPGKGSTFYFTIPDRP
ncbi:MAG: GAF domain-containing protein [Betaproteobacteria bacterium]|nr:GAF domain-containing protein [Betaproteobacteria bacterium]